MNKNEKKDFKHDTDLDHIYDPEYTKTMKIKCAAVRWAY